MAKRTKMADLIRQGQKKEARKTRKFYKAEKERQQSLGEARKERPRINFAEYGEGCAYILLLLLMILVVGSIFYFFAAYS